MSVVSPPATEASTAELLGRFDEALADEGVALELCVVGGAVIQLAFDADPDSRRPRALFVAPNAAVRASRRAAERGQVPLDRLEDVAREHVAAGTDSAVRCFDGRALRVFDAPPDYVLAMKCAAQAFAPEPGVQDDIRYLLRFLGLRSADTALEVIDRYLNSRQRPSDLAQRLDTLLG